MRTAPGLLLALLLAAAPSKARAQEEGAGDGLPAQLRMGGFLLFNNTSAPMSLVTLPAKPAGAVDLGEVQARSCQHGLSIPIAASFRPTSFSGAMGNGGFDKTLAQLKKDRPELAGIYDVRVDLRVFSILGIYRKLCLELVARGFR